MADEQPLAPRLKDRKRPKDHRQICKKFLWGKCDKFAHCKYRHELDIPEMRKTVKFCRNFQNRVGCHGKDCTYLHTSKDEQRLFLETGQLPRVLLQRHAALNAVAANANMTWFTKPVGEQQQISGFQLPSTLTSFVMPPLPPLPNKPISQIHIPPKIVQSLLTPPPETISQSYVPSITAQLLPPPSLPGSSNNAQLITHHQVNKAFRELPQEFGTSRPPPAINQQFSPTTGCKRKSSPQWQIEAGTSKTANAAKPDHLCENCIELEQRTLQLKSEIDKNLDKESNLKFVLIKKTQEHEWNRELLFSIIWPEHKKAVSALIEATEKATVPTETFLERVKSLLNSNIINPSGNIFNMEHNINIDLAQLTSSSSYVSQPIMTNFEFSSIYLYCVTDMRNSVTYEEFKEMLTYLKTHMSNLVNRVNIPNLQNAVERFRRSTPFDRFSALFQPTVAQPNVASHSQIAHSQSSSLGIGGNIFNLGPDNVVPRHEVGSAVERFRRTAPSDQFSALFQPTVSQPNVASLPQFAQSSRIRENIWNLGPDNEMPRHDGGSAVERFRSSAPFEQFSALFQPTVSKPNVASDLQIAYSQSSNLVINENIWNFGSDNVVPRHEGESAVERFRSSAPSYHFSALFQPTVAQPNVAPQPQIAYFQSANPVISENLWNLVPDNRVLRPEGASAVERFRSSAPFYHFPALFQPTVPQPNVAAHPQIAHSQSLRPDNRVLRPEGGSAVKRFRSSAPFYHSPALFQPTVPQPNVASHPQIAHSQSSNPVISENLWNLGPDNKVLRPEGGSAVERFRSSATFYHSPALFQPTVPQPNVASHPQIAHSQSSNPVISENLWNLGPDNKVLRPEGGSAVERFRSSATFYHSPALFQPTVPQPNVASHPQIAHSQSSNPVISENLWNLGPDNRVLRPEGASAVERFRSSAPFSHFPALFQPTVPQPNVASHPPIVHSQSSNPVISENLWNLGPDNRVLRPEGASAVERFRSSAPFSNFPALFQPTVPQPNVASHPPIVHSQSSNPVISENLWNLGPDNRVLRPEGASAVERFRSSAPFSHFPALFQPTVPQPNVASHPPIVHSQSSNIVMWQPVVAAPTPQMSSSTDDDDGLTRQSDGYYVYGNKRHSM